VLAQKKSARLTVNKLLQVIFQDKTIDLWWPDLALCPVKTSQKTLGNTPEKQL
jgi:hypothetical protein